MVSNQLLNSGFLLAVAGGSPQPLFGAARAGSAPWLPLKPAPPRMSSSAAGRPHGNSLMFGDSDLKSTHQPAASQLWWALWLCLLLPKCWAPLLLLSWGSFCIAARAAAAGAGHGAPGPSCCGSTEAGARPRLALSPAPRACQQRVVAPSKARGCKQFPALPSLN